MKTLRYIILLGLAAALLAGCGALPPLMPNAAGPTAAVSVATEAPAAEAPAATEAPAAGQEAATPAPAATEASPAAPTSEAAPAPEQVMGANPLAGVVWEWAALIKTKPPTQSVVPDPSSYTVIFGADGEMAIKADCNNARATYVLDNDKLTISLGAVTRAACPPGSLSADFLTSLSKVGSYIMDGDDLILRLAENDDAMIFRNGGPSSEPAPPPAATEAPAGAPAETAAPQLVGTTWQWESFVDVATGKGSFEVANPENYTVTFVDDGTAAMQADCNRAAGTYTVNGSSLNVVVGPVTLAACEPDSRGAQFLINLTSAGTFTFEDGKLAIDLQADGGRMIFRAAK